MNIFDLFKKKKNHAIQAEDESIVVLEYNGDDDFWENDNVLETLTSKIDSCEAELEVLENEIGMFEGINPEKTKLLKDKRKALLAKINSLEKQRKSELDNSYDLQENSSIKR